MDFDEFKYKISNLKNLKLPGEEAQHKLAPILRIKELEKLDIANKNPNKNPNKAGVMAVFYPNKSDQTNFILILRKTYKGVHSNQVGFPGGRLEIFDKNLEHTALRETEEEVGIPKEEVEIVKKLTKLYIPPSNFWVHPYVGLIEKTPILVPQKSEVEKILEVNIDEFLDEKSLIKQKLSTSYASNIEVPAFSLNGLVVWGATAMMLSELKELLKEIL
ncbi:MAG: CoA pyrophosphatase [Flavobacteriaceae bacterium]|nr:CoA pyrophosphatase [Flavobacteriaceae bacterium]